MLKCVRFILEKGCVSNYVYTLWKEKKTINTIKLKYLFKALKVNSSYDCVQIFIQFVSKNTNKCVLLLTTGGMSSKSTPALCHMTSQCCRRNTLPEKKTKQNMKLYKYNHNFWARPTKWTVQLLIRTPISSVTWNLLDFKWRRSQVSKPEDFFFVKLHSGAAVPSPQVMFSICTRWK